MFENLHLRSKVKILRDKGFDRPAIYCLWFAQGSTKKRQYIGETHCLWERMEQHDREWGPRVWSHFTFKDASSSKSSRKAEEARLIQRYDPPYNKQQKPTS